MKYILYISAIEAGEVILRDPYIMSDFQYSFYFRLSPSVLLTICPCFVPIAYLRLYIRIFSVLCCPVIPGDGSRLRNPLSRH